MNLCRRCRSDFASVSAFDRHRVGQHHLDFPEHEDGRRCADEDERVELGLEADGSGRWRFTLSDADQEHLSELRGRRSKGLAGSGKGFPRGEP